MESSKEADLTTAVLMYAIRCMAEGDQTALRQMRFGAREVDALRGMTLADLYRVESLSAHCLDISLNNQVYWPMMGLLRQQRESEEMQQNLIAADAPLEMMQALFGVGAREYTRLRRLFSVDPSVGRPPDPDEEASHTLWRVWVARTQTEESALAAPEVYFDVYQETGVPLRAIWNLTQRWSEFGDLNGEPEKTEAARSRIDE